MEVSQICQVCKMRFLNQTLLYSHMKNTPCGMHMNQFQKNIQYNNSIQPSNIQPNNNIQPEQPLQRLKHLFISDQVQNLYTARKNTPRQNNINNYLAQNNNNYLAQNNNNYLAQNNYVDKNQFVECNNKKICSGCNKNITSKNFARHLKLCEQPEEVKKDKKDKLKDQLCRNCNKYFTS